MIRFVLGVMLIIVEEFLVIMDVIVVLWLLIGRFVCILIKLFVMVLWVVRKLVFEIVMIWFWFVKLVVCV